jgi:hypothetical protein
VVKKSKMRTHTELASAQAGVIVVNNTAAVLREFHAIYVLEDTIIASLTDEGGNAVGAYIKAPGTAVKAGAFITPFNRQKPFSGITLTSGSVSLIL